MDVREVRRRLEWIKDYQREIERANNDSREV